RERLQVLWSRHFSPIKSPHSVRDEGGPPRYHPISHRHAADGHSWGALSGSTRMRFSAHRLRSEFPRSVSLRAHSHDPHSLRDVLAVLLSVVAIDLRALTRARSMSWLCRLSSC